LASALNVEYAALNPDPPDRQARSTDTFPIRTIYIALTTALFPDPNKTSLHLYLHPWLHSPAQKNKRIKKILDFGLRI
jgi:hypothetical protein